MNSRIETIVHKLVNAFDQRPKFDDLADYLPFICAFDQSDFTLRHVARLKNELERNNNLFVIPLSRSVAFSHNYEIVLGLVEVYRLLGDENVLNLALDVMDSSIQTFVWNKRVVRKYYPRIRLPFPVISLYSYSLLELLVDLYDITTDNKYIDLAKDISHDITDSPFFRKYSLFPRGDYLYLQGQLGRFWFPKSTFIGKDSCVIFGLVRYAQTTQDEYIINKALAFLRTVDTHMVQDGVVYRLYQPETGYKKQRNLAAAFMFMNMLNHTYSRFAYTDLLDSSRRIADTWIEQQSELGLFPFAYGKSASWLDSETDMSIALLELYELTDSNRYLNAASRCYQGILEHNLKASSVDIDTGQPVEPVNFCSRTPTPKFLGLFLKLAYYFEKNKRIYGDHGIESLVRDR